jgi:Ca2+-binding EF-hand superfamily protein
MARNLGHKIYAAFDSQSTGEVAFSHIAAGLSFLCGGSPLEDKLMVAFAVVDDDSDGYISGEQFGTIAHAVLTLVYTCSKLVAKKVVASGVSVAELSGAAAKEGLTALSLTEDDTEISFEMLSEISEDFVKLSALF